MLGVRMYWCVGVLVWVVCGLLLRLFVVYCLSWVRSACCVMCLVCECCCLQVYVL